MSRYSNLSALLLTSFMKMGCIEAAYQEGAALAPTDTGTGTSSTGEPGTPTTSGGDGDSGPGVQTVTSAEESSTPISGSSSTADATSSNDETSVGDSTGAPVNAPPEIEFFAADPPQLSEAGAADIKLTASADVVIARLSLNGEQIFEGPPTKFPFVYEALSAKYNFPHHFEVEVEDEEGLKATATTDLVVQLPQPGAEKCLFKDAGAIASGVNALVYTHKAIYAVGSRDSGSGLKLTVWALDPDHCEVVLPGWPKTIAGWTGEPDLGVPMSGGVAVAVDEIGNLAIGGNLIVNGTTQPYVALLTSDGARLWERTGSVGSELAGLAAFTGQYSDRVVGVGWRRTNDNPVRTDAQVWTYQPTDDDWVILTEYTLKAPFLPGEKEDEFNILSEWARAVLVKDGVAFIVGEREFEDDPNMLFKRMFLARLDPSGSVEPLWTSWGVHAVNDAARSIASCGEQLVAGGWDRNEPVDAKPEPLIAWFDSEGSFAGSRPDALAWTQTNGIACDSEGKIVSGGVRLSGDGDAQVFTVPGQPGPRTWYETGVAGPDAVGAVACDPRGFCAAGGWRTANGKFHATLRVFHP